MSLNFVDAQVSTVAEMLGAVLRQNVTVPSSLPTVSAAAQGEEVTAGEVRVQTDGQADRVIERRSQALQAGEGSWGSYRLMATLVDPRGGVALLEDRRGRVRVVRAGGSNALGIQFEIRPGRLSVKRQLRDYTGRLVSETSELRLGPWP